jgi:aminoglycoside phosphotransferase (APT) family kinase protein
MLCALMVLLADPEPAWSHAVLRAVDRAEVERRLGPTDERIEVLSGGFDNRNVRVGRDRVLRITDPATLPIQVTLLSRPWRSLRTPRVLATGDDFIVVEYLPLSPLDDAPAVGAAVGRALAEIHATRYAGSGFLAADLSLAQPFARDGDGGADYVRAMLAEAAPFLDAALVARVHAFVAVLEAEAAAAYDGGVLSHGDFKVSNLHLLPDGALVVLDWDFAWAGPRLFDVGQILRWCPPAPFVDAFAAGYRDGGGVLVDGWRRVGEMIDVGSMCAVYAHNPIMRSNDEIPRRIAEIVDAG